MDDKHSDDPPSAKAVDSDGYNQTYIIMKASSKKDSKQINTDGREVFFRCGNWCYLGQVQFGNLVMGLTDIPVIIPTLQKQQGSLRYFCNASSIPKSSQFASPNEFLHEAARFFASEIVSESIESELIKMAKIFPWIDDDNSSTYFEFALGSIPEYLEDVDIIASKTYTRGLVIISIYFEESIYFIIQNGEGDQALLDIRFPNVSQHGQGLLLGSYDREDYLWRRLTLWHILSTDMTSLKRSIPKIKTIDVSSTNYEQTYCIMKSHRVDSESQNLSVHHDVLFRFGSWCYSGRVQLIPTLSLSDIPFVIPALRMQQSRLDFLCDVSAIPTTSPFAPALKYVHSIAPFLEQEIINSEDTIRDLIDRLSDMGLGDSVAKWLDGDPLNSFFEFKIVEDRDFQDIFANMELVASKVYNPSGIITVTIVFQQTIYVSIIDGSKENPLLDSRFPDVSGKGRGYQVATFPSGTKDWPSLRKVSIWQTVSALEQEFRERAAQYAQNKSIEDSSREEDSLARDEKCTPVVGESKASYSEIAAKGTETALTRTTPTSLTVDVTTGEVSSPATQKFSQAAESKQVDRSSPSHHSKGDEFSPSLDEAVAITASKQKVDVEDLSSQPRQFGSLASVARPHHIPKLDSLSKKMDDIRKNLGDGGDVAPWDTFGKPLLGGLKK